MERNRNLSDVINSIQDEGPSATVAQSATTAADSASRPVTAQAGARRYIPWIIICLLAGLLIAGVFILGVGGGNLHR